MTNLDAELVRRWFAVLREPGRRLIPYVVIELTDSEREVLDEGEELVSAAVERGELPSGGVTGPDQVVRNLRAYLQGMASGIGGSRVVFAQANGPAAGLVGQDRASETMCLVAGLLAGAAALDGASGPTFSDAGPTAADAARAAGLAAADTAVNGADVHRVAQVAAHAATTGWAPGLSHIGAARENHRTRGLICVLLLALERASAPADPPAFPAACGAGPGDNTGRVFEAEVTFEMRLQPSAARDLHRRLGELGTDVTMWSTQDVTSFHLHTRQAGEAIAEAYSVGMPFDLTVTSRD